MPEMTYTPSFLIRASFFRDFVNTLRLPPLDCQRRQPLLVKKVFLTSWWTGEQAIHNSQWSPCCAWRLAVFPPLSSAWSLRIVRKLTRGAPCFTGLIDGYCTLNSQWSSCCALRLAVLPCSLGLLRPVSRTARGLRAPPPYTPPGTIEARKGFGSTIRHGRSASLASSLAALPASLGLLRAASPTGRALRAPLAPPAASRPPIVHCASLRVLATSALRASDVRKLTRGAPCFTGLIGGYCSHWLRRLFRPHWAYYGLFPPLAAAFVRPCASLARCSVPAHFVCSPLQPFGPSPFCKHLLPKNTRNDVHAVISD